MTRYLPTPEERAALEAKGWCWEIDGWWLRRAKGGKRGAHTYRQALREQERRERERWRKR